MKIMFAVSFIMQKIYIKRQRITKQNRNEIIRLQKLHFIFL